ncbi:MAG TPA: monooxygenase, partial [Acidimicrobiales bacterium]|nr:monooxygenase [Acidimicrobiales bacterium]
IFGHARRIAEHFKLYDKALFSTQVTKLEWDEEISRWIVHTNRGDRIRAQFVSMGTGPLHRPKLPGVPGIESFAGHCFHTSRWDYDYTGGSYAGAPMDKLADKRVGIIGTGATAVQCIPPLAASAETLYVFQRTPSSIDVRGNRPIDPEWFETLEPGWQSKWLTNFATLQSGGFTDEDLVMDGWTDISKRIRDRVVADMGENFGPDSIRLAYEASDDEKMQEIRARVNEIVEDEEVAEALKPWYRQLCKRPCFHDEYLQAYNRPNTHLVDTDGQGVERIDETGVWVAGKHYEVDCLVFASGFEVGTAFARRSGYETYGRNGVSLTDRWANGMRSLHGIHVSGFPNLFIVSLFQAAALVSNVTHNLVEAGTTIAAVVSHALEIGAGQVEATEKAEQAWIDRLSNEAGVFGDPDCTPGYYNNEGKPMERVDWLNASRFPEGPVAYFYYIDTWRKAGEYAGLEFR